MQHHISPIIREQAHTVTRVNGLFHVYEKLFRHTGIPDPSLEFGLVQKLDLLRAWFVAVCVDSILNLIHNRYVGNGGPVSLVTVFAFLVLKTLKYSVAFGHFLEFVS